MSDRIEAIHLVALAIEEKKQRGKPGHAKALKMCADARKIWREQFHKCSKCGRS